MPKGICYNAGGENGCPSVPLLPHGFDCPFQNEKVKGCLRQFFSMLPIADPQALEQVRGYYRYLTHKDNPEKAQYDEREIKTINGFNIADFSELTRSEITQIKKTLQALIRQYDIVEYAQLMDFLQDEEMNVEYEVASNNTLFFDRYIGSRRHAPRVPKCDPETGEVIEKKES